jgi:protein SCO1/2
LASSLPARPRTRRGPTLALAASLAAAVGLTGACAPADEAFDRSEGRDGLRGLELPEPYRPDDFTLTDTGGEPWSLHERTEGKLALLFFGYTYCPDICPVQMAVLDAALEDLAYVDRQRVEVVFVTTDPDRDTPDRLREWLDRFDPAFVGLVGDLEAVNEIQAALGLPEASPEAPDPSSDSTDYDVGHATPVVAITPDGRVRALYPSGVRQTDWRHDLPLLLNAAN